MSTLRAPKWLLAVLALVAALAVAGCGDDSDDTAGSTGTGTGNETTEQQFETVEPGVLTVGSDIPYRPFEFGRAPDFEGFDVDIVNAVAEEMGYDAKFVKTPFDTIFNNLAQGQFDAVASAVTITDERKEAVDFSAPYFPADQSLMVRRDSDISTVEDLEGEIVGAQIGTTGAEYAREETPAEDVRTFDVIDDAFQALNAEQVAAVINDFPVSKYAERQHENLEVVATIETGEQYGIAFQKEGDELRTAFDEALATIKENGTYAEIFREWFEEDPPQSILDAGPTQPAE